MVVDIDKTISLLNLIAREQQVKVAVKESFRGSAMAGGGAFAGGLMGGPPGLFIGGIVGTICGYLFTRDTFVSIPEAIDALPHHRRQAIAAHVQDIIDQLEATDLAVVMQLAVAASAGGPTAVMENVVLRTVVNKSIEFIQNQISEEQRENPGFLAARRQ